MYPLKTGPALPSRDQWSAASIPRGASLFWKTQLWCHWAFHKLAMDWFKGQFTGLSPMIIWKIPMVSGVDFPKKINPLQNPIDNPVVECYWVYSYGVSMNFPCWLWPDWVRVALQVCLATAVHAAPEPIRSGANAAAVIEDIEEPNRYKVVPHS